MKNYSYTFSINEPCSESWQNMPASEKGKFCMNCQKEVIDFSSMRDEEIIRLIGNSNRNVCGRFRNTQLDRSMQPLSFNLSRPVSLRAIVTGIIMLTVIAPSRAETNSSPQEKIVHTYSEENHNPVLSDSIGSIYKGRFLASDSLPMPGLSAKIMNSSANVMLDTLGRFEIRIPDSLARDTFEIFFFSDETLMDSFIVNGENTDYSKEHTIYMKEILTFDTVGMYTVGAVVTVKKRNFFQRIFH